MKVENSGFAPDGSSRLLETNPSSAHDLNGAPVSPPGPKTPAAIQTLRWVVRPESFMDSCWRQYGPIFSARLGGFERLGPSDVVFVAEPAALKRLFTGGSELSRVGESRESIVPVVGPASLLVLDGSDHLRQRRYMLPPFHGESIQRFGTTIEAITASNLDGWPEGEPFALLPRMHEIALEMLMRITFGERWQDLVSIRRNVERLLKRTANVRTELLLALPPRIGPLDLRSGLVKLRVDLDDSFLQEIHRRRGLDSSDDGDALSLLLEARDEEGQAMTDSELCDELVTILLGGHENPAVGMAWMFENLLRDPSAMKRATEEARDDSSASRPYLDAVVGETLRLRPPIPIATRAIRTELTLGGYLIKPGTFVLPAIYVLHRRPDLYPDPTRFDPNRFIGRQPEPYAFIPFGGGSRRCIGANLAPLAMRSTLKAVLEHVELEPASSSAETAQRRAVVLAPRHGVRVIARCRGRSSSVGVPKPATDDREIARPAAEVRGSLGGEGKDDL